MKEQLPRVRNLWEQKELERSTRAKVDQLTERREKQGNAQRIATANGGLLAADDLQAIRRNAERNAMLHDPEESGSNESSAAMRRKSKRLQAFQVNAPCIVREMRKHVVEMGGGDAGGPLIIDRTPRIAKNLKAIK